MEIDPYNLEDLKLIESFLKIVIKNDINIDLPIYKQYVDIKKSLDYSLQFVNTINSKYKDELIYALENRSVEFNQSNYDNSISKVLVSKGRKIIDLEVTNTIYDTYNFTHEGFHYINMDINNLSTNWWLMTETFSMTAETLQKRYFERNYIDILEYKYNEIGNYLGVKEKAYMLHFEIELLKEYLNKKYISEDFIYKLLSDKSDEYIYLACEDMKKVCDTLYMSFSNLQNYIISAVLSAHLLKRIIERNSYDEFIELNDNCNNMEFVDTLKYLDLKLDDEKNIVLSKSSLELLNEEYSERILSLRK